MGMLRDDDLVFFLSKSGESGELLALVPHLQNHLVVATSNPNSRLANAADHVVTLPIEKELCPYDLAPTISTSVQLLFGDLLAMAIMREKKISLTSYANNHPSGTIGKKATLLVEDLMKKGGDIPLCSPDDTLMDVIVELSNKKCGCLVIVSKEKHLLGIFTDGDLRRSLSQEGAKVLEKKMEHLMTPHPITASPKDLVYQTMKRMQEDRLIMMAPVVEEEQVVGLIHIHDIIHEGI